MRVAHERRVRRDAGFGQRLLEAMDRRRVRPGELALALGVGGVTVSRWRKGECPDDLRLPALAAHLQVPEEWLKGGGGALPDWERRVLPQAAPEVTAGRSPGRRTTDQEAARKAVELEAAKMQRDAARLEVLAQRFRAYRRAGKTPSPDILGEWEEIARANSLDEVPELGSPATPPPDPGAGPDPA